jgi:hypothetical protein
VSISRAARPVLILGVLIPAGLLVVLLAGNLRSPRSRSEPQPSSPASVGKSYDPGVFHGVSVSRLDDTHERSLTLDEAIARTDYAFSMPDSAVAGPIAKIVPNETVWDRSGKGRTGLMIRYDSGIELIIEPSPVDLQGMNRAVAGTLPFRDGRTRPFELRTMAGLPLALSRAGIQYQGSAEMAVPAQVVWNMGDANYRLRGPAIALDYSAFSDEDSATVRVRASEVLAEQVTSAVSVEELERLVAAMVPASGGN